MRQLWAVFWRECRVLQASKSSEPYKALKLIVGRSPERDTVWPDSLSDWLTRCSQMGAALLLSRLYSLQGPYPGSTGLVTRLILALQASAPCILIAFCGVLSVVTSMSRAMKYISW